MDIITRNSTFMLQRSMDYLWAKQGAILDNISNAETPNYKPKVVTFEQSLRDKLVRAATAPHARQQVQRVLEKAQFAVNEPQLSTRMDENGVNITEQSVELTRNSYQLQYVMNSISSDLSVLRLAIRGQ